MVSLIQNFTTTQSNQNILELSEVLNAIKVMFGESTYLDLVNHKSVPMEITAVFCNSPTKIEIRYNYNEPTIAQDLINNNMFTYPMNFISQIISTQATNGTIFLKIK